MQQGVAKHKHSHFHFLFTGDESWMFYAYNHRTIWVASWDDEDEIERPSHFQQKAMLTIFFNGTRDANSAILPASQQMIGTYFIEYVPVPLTEVCYPKGRKPHEGRVMGYFDNAQTHNTEVVREHLVDFGFTRMEHPPQNPD
jgi:hypothetical protein